MCFFASLRCTCWALFKSGFNLGSDTGRWLTLWTLVKYGHGRAISILWLDRPLSHITEFNSFLLKGPLQFVCVKWKSRAQRHGTTCDMSTSWLTVCVTDVQKKKYHVIWTWYCGNTGRVCRCSLPWTFIYQCLFLQYTWVNTIVYVHSESWHPCYTINIAWYHHITCKGMYK